MGIVREKTWSPIIDSLILVGFIAFGLYLQQPFHRLLEAQRVE
jgi:hypothetical protein